MKKKQCTIKDLAEKLNIHHTTVSRAIRNHPDVNSKTRELVLKAAEKYKYIPNSFAKGLRSAKSKTIVVMVPVIRNYFFSEVMDVITRFASDQGYTVMIYQSNEDSEVELRNIESIIENRVAGVIASVADVHKNHDKFWQLENTGIPVVLFDRFYEHNFSRINVDNFQGGYDATEYLLKKGYNKLAFNRGTVGNPVFDERYRGFTAAMLDYKIKVQPGMILEGGLKLDDGVKLIQKLRNNKSLPDALICVVDRVALGVIVEARDLGISIPEDLALIGFDNEPAGRIIRPALTTISQPIERIGESAFNLLKDKMNNTVEIISEEFPLPMELIVRSSA